MKIIALEGIDGSGKSTQFRLLVKYLNNLGFKVAHSSFHQYNTPTGNILKQWLNNEYMADQKTFELIAVADKQAFQEDIKRFEEENYDFLVLDRYISSQLVYGMATGTDRQWILDISRYLRKPDIEIFIDISPTVSMNRKSLMGEMDRYERDFALLTRVVELYRTQCYRKLNANVVDGEHDKFTVHRQIKSTLRMYGVG